MTMSAALLLPNLTTMGVWTFFLRYFDRVSLEDFLALLPPLCIASPTYIALRSHRSMHSQ